MDHKDRWLQEYEEILSQTGREPSNDQIRERYVSCVPSLLDKQDALLDQQRDAGEGWGGPRTQMAAQAIIKAFKEGKLFNKGEKK